jgi:hypothetical protein
MHKLPHNHSKNPRHVHPLLYVSPYINTCNKSEPFPDIFSTAEIFSSGFFSFNPLDQILLLPIYNTPKSKSNHTFWSYLQVQSHSFLYVTPQPLAFTSLAIFKYPLPHLISLFPQNPLANLLLKIWSRNLLKHFHWAAETAFHLSN